MLNIKKAADAAKFLIDSRALRLHFATHWIEDTEILKYVEIMDGLYLKNSVLKGSITGDIRIHFSKDMVKENLTTPCEHIKKRPCFVKSPDLPSKIFHNAGLIIDCGFSGVTFDYNSRDIASDKLLIMIAMDNGWDFLYADETAHFGKGHLGANCKLPCFNI